jgi:hypothetical protein
MVRFFLSFALVLLCKILHAQNFEQFNISQNLADPRQVEAIDFDGDTLEELLVSSAEGLFLYQNLGGAQFSKQALLDSIETVFRFSIFDWGAMVIWTYFSRHTVSTKK